MMCDLDMLARLCHENAVKHGFWNDLHTADPLHLKATRLALIHSEVSEMLEAIRKPDLTGHIPGLPLENEEAADVFIRLLDYCHAFNIDLESAVRLKMAFNETRPYKHGKEM